MKVLIVGSGGREHALAWACSRSKLHPVITCAPGNGGAARIARNVDISADSIDEIVDYVRDQRFDLVIIGPEAPLVAGLADKLGKYGYPVFGPDRDAARIEGSKSFAKYLMLRANVQTPEFATFSDLSQAQRHIQSHGAPIVVKASGLAAGKGVVVCNSVQEALHAAQVMLGDGEFGEAGREIIVEDCLTGRELSLLALVDGEDYLLLPPSRDHKRAYDGDQGPNTGGMGAYTPLPDLTQEELSRIVLDIFPPVLGLLAASGMPYRGCMYAGIMMTEIGSKVLEFNCRFGDPETQAILPILKIDLLEAMAETAAGGLRRWISVNGLQPQEWLSVTGGLSSVSVVAAASGYPGSYCIGMPINSLPPESDSLVVFHAGTKLKDGVLLTSGGRVLNITGVATNLVDAAEKAYQGVAQVKFEGVTYRKDIGRKL